MIKQWWIGLLVLTLLVGCAQLPWSSAEFPGHRLRITNTGTQQLNSVVIIFPNDRITYGPVAPGASTDYQAVPGGVYGYAAYEIVVGGTTINQPVIDWMGEEPLDGTAFTYRLTVDPTRIQFQQIQHEVVQES